MIRAGNTVINFDQETVLQSLQEEHGVDEQLKKINMMLLQLLLTKNKKKTFLLKVIKQAEQQL